MVIIWAFPKIIIQVAPFLSIYGLPAALHGSVASHNSSLLDNNSHKYLHYGSWVITKQLSMMATLRRSTLPTDSGVSTPSLDHSISSKLSCPASQSTVPKPSTGKNPILYLECFIQYSFVFFIPVNSPLGLEENILTGLHRYNIFYSIFIDTNQLYFSSQ